MFLRRAFWILALVLGLLGVVACIVGFAAVLSLGSRLGRVDDRVFARIDAGMVSTQERVRRVQERVDESKITCNELEQSLRDWGTRKALDGLEARLEIERRVEKLAGHLQLADSWLETSTESMRNLQQFVELGNFLGTARNTALIDEVLEKITSLRSMLQQADQALDEIREFNANQAGESDANRFSRVLKLIGRVLVTIGDMDTRLDEYATQLSELQTVARQWKSTTRRYIGLATMGFCVLLAWVAAGQVALGLWGWANVRQHQSQAVDLAA